MGNCAGKRKGPSTKLSEARVSQFMRQIETVETEFEGIRLKVDFSFADDINKELRQLDKKIEENLKAMNQDFNIEIKKYLTETGLPNPNISLDNSISFSDKKIKYSRT